jgi:hypothetical protein
MKSYDSRTYSLNDFVEWEAAKQLELNPRFQRRPVWTDNAKSYLMDTIVRGKPIPKVFIRQKINVSTKKSVREVVDGQQRLRTILSFIKDGFKITKKHHKDLGGMLFSQLPEDVQEQILAYEISVDLLINLPDPEVLDIFSRLNAYAVTLNDQEKLNADHFGPFKVMADNIAHKYYDYWINQHIVPPRSVMRMQEVALVADLLIAMIEGIKSKKQIRKSYGEYEKQFDFDTDLLEKQFDQVMAKLSELYPEGLSETEFRRPHIFYSLFTAVAHCELGIPKLAVARVKLDEARIPAARNGLDTVAGIFTAVDVAALSKEEQQFLQDARRATTDESVRERRTTYLVGLM